MVDDFNPDPRNLYKNVAIGLCCFDTGLRFLDINDWLAALSGLPVEDHLGKPVSDVWPEIAPAVEDLLRQIIATGKAVTDKRFAIADPANPNRVITCNHSYTAIRAEDGAIAGVSCVVDNITDRLCAETIARDSNVRLQGYLDDAADWLWETDHAGYFTYVSEKYYQFTGAVEGSAVGASLIDLARTFETPEARKAYEQALANRQPFRDLVARRKLPDGQIGWTENTGTPNFGEDGAFLGYRGVSRDVTESKRTADELQATTKLLQSILEIVPAGISFRDRDGTIIFINDPGAGIIGLTPEDLIGKTMREVLGPGGIIDSEEMILRAIASGQPIRDHILAPDHLPGREFLGNVIPINSADGEIAGVISIVQEITEIRAAENELRRLFSALDSLPDIVAIYDPDDRLIYTNGAVYPALDDAKRASFVGLTFAQVMRQVVEAGLITDAVGREEAWLEERIAAHRNPREPIIYHRHDGVTSLIYEQRLEDGSTATIGHDITEAEAAREARRESEALYRDLVEGSLQGMMVHRGQVPVYANEAFIRMFGYESLEDLLRVRSIGDFVHHDDVDRVIARAMRRSAGEDFSPLAELRGLRKDGGNVWILTSARSIQWQGEAAIQVTAIDITDRKEAELANERTETRFRAFFENAQTGNIVIDSSGTVADFNSAAATIFGYGADEVIGRNVSMLMASHDGERHDDYLKKYLATGQGSIIGIGREVLGRRKNGEEIPIHLAIGEINAGSERTFVGSIIDLTETKKLEGQLFQSQKMEAVGHLTGGIAHDFNNLLGIIKGNLELARRRLPSEDRSTVYLAEGLDAVDRAAALTHRLLAFARQQPLQQRPVDLREIIGGMEDLLRRTISENIALDVVLEAGGGSVLIDPRQFENALLNLVLNARDAMPDGGHLTIETAADFISGGDPGLEAGVEPGRYQVISVRDTGVGMAEDHLQKAFDPFFTTKPFGMGSGLGLSMLHGFVRQSGGDVVMASEVGVGTVVRMYLPLSETPAGSTAASHRRQSGGPSPVGRGLTVLVVEDDPELRNVAAEVMQSFEFEVLQARDGDTAKTIFDEGTNVDLLFTDIVLPGTIDGRELADLARENIPDLKVLVCSGYSREGLSADKADDSGIDFISKPYGIQDLASAVERVLQHD